MWVGLGNYSPRRADDLKYVPLDSENDVVAHVTFLDETGLCLDNGVYAKINVN